MVTTLRSLVPYRNGHCLIPSPCRRILGHTHWRTSDRGVKLAPHTM